jgi:hypothetical protein
MYGDRQQLQYGSSTVMHNYLWHATRAFFEEGGKRLYVSRVFRALSGEYPPDDFSTSGSTPKTGNDYNDGHARASIGTSGDNSTEIRARFPGRAGNMRVRLTLRPGQSVLTGDIDKDTGQLVPRVSALLPHDVVWISDVTSPVGSPPGTGTLYVADSYFDKDKKQTEWEKAIRFVL